MKSFYLVVRLSIMILFCLIFNTNKIYGNENNKNNKKKNYTINFKITVIDSVQNSPLELVNLILKRENEIVGMNITNKFGIAIFHDVEEGKYQLICHYIGYKDYSTKIIINQSNNSIKIPLQQSTVGLKEVVVRGSKAVHVSNYVDLRTGYKTFTEETFHPAPSSRMTTVIQENLTGAVRAPTGEVHIRGQHGEFTYLIDGIPIPLGVFGGLNEVVNPEVIKNITFYDGGFPAEFGGQSAAIIDAINQVPPGGFHLSISSYAGSFLTSNNNELGSKVGVFKALNSNGQTISFSNHLGKLGYFFSGSRRETIRRVDQPIEKLFHDHGFDYSLYGKIDYLIGNNDYLTSNLNYSSTYTQIPFDPVEGINFDNQNSYNSFQTISYYHTFSNRVDKASNLFAGLYIREGGLEFLTSPYDQTRQFIGNDTTISYTVNQNRRFVTYGSRIKYSKELSHHFAYAAGLNFNITNGNEDFTFKDINGNGPKNISTFTGSDFSLFAQTNIHPFEWTRLEAGLRYDQHIAPVIQLQKQFSPRLKISFFPDETNTFYFSYDRLFIPTNIEGLSSVAIAVGDSASATLPEKDNLFEVGIIHNFSYGITAKLDYFQKDSSPGLDDETLGSSTIRVNVNINKVNVKGIEFSLTYGDPGSPFSGYVNSSIIHAYGMGPVSGGFLPSDSSTTPFDLDHDQRLSAVIGLNYQPSNWFLNLVAIYGSGLANGNDGYIFKTDLFNFNQGAHTTPYWIINFSSGYIFRLKTGYTIEPSIYINNLLDHAHLLKGAFFSGASFEARRNVVFKISLHI